MRNKSLTIVRFLLDSQRFLLKGLCHPELVGQEVSRLPVHDLFFFRISIPPPLSLNVLLSPSIENAKLLLREGGYLAPQKVGRR